VWVQGGIILALAAVAYYALRLLGFTPVGSLIFAVFLAPVAFVILLVVGLMAIIFVSNVMGVIREWRFRKRVRARGRYTTWRKLVEQFGPDSGTVLIDGPTLGWGISRAWWTHENVIREAPCSRPKSPREIFGGPSPHAFELWCYERYTSPESGTAILFGVWNGKRRALKLARVIGAPILHVWSGSLDPLTRSPSGQELADQMVASVI
jgi:hypothetical protein